jgi:hypothetical protein
VARPLPFADRNELAGRADADGAVDASAPVGRPFTTRRLGAGRAVSGRDAPDHRGRRLVAPLGLVVAVAMVAGTAWWLAGGLRVRTATVPVEAPADPGAGAIPERGMQAFAIIRSDTPDEDVVELVDSVTTQSSSVQGVRAVESVTNVGVLVSSPDGALTTTPAFGSRSELDATVGLEARVKRAADGLLGTAGLVSEDGRSFLVTAEIDPTLPPEEQAAAARSFRDRVTLAASVSGVPVTVSFGGQALTVAAATEGARNDLALLVGLACVAPAAIALVLLRRRVPAGALLAAGGAALLLAALLVNGEAAQGRVGALDRDDPLSVADDLADRELRGTIPVTIDVTGAAGAFRRPDVLARMDALSTWLRSEYDVDAVDLPTTLRAEAGAITGVDSIPASPGDIDRLLAESEVFAGDLLDRTTNDDLSRTRIVAWVPDEGRARIDELANRLDRISVVVFEDLGISVRFGADVVATTPTRQSLAKSLALLGLLGIALGAVLALGTAWDRHRHEERHRERHRRLFGPGGRHPATAGRARHRHPDHDGHDDDHHDRRWSRSLFARHGHGHGDAPTPAGDDRATSNADGDPDAADRFTTTRRSGAGSR